MSSSFTWIPLLFLPAYMGMYIASRASKIHLKREISNERTMLNLSSDSHLFQGYNFKSKIHYSQLYIMCNIQQNLIRLFCIDTIYILMSAIAVTKPRTLFHAYFKDKGLHYRWKRASKWISAGNALIYCCNESLEIEWMANRNGWGDHTHSMDLVLFVYHIDGLVQERRNSSALAM